ncbi:MAG: class I SAM-dependent methyltransferase [Gammaproteobacteria bacterium]|nr:class I SAM-dependent methyltransferase [Gammaproteobacteria bacterium]MDH3507485.1 class I SAM-dependent methyltransferase [Gammaproteobacteria bacterium]
MSEIDREKWDERYASGAYAARTYPTQLLADWLDQLPRGRALDVACGAGRNALYLAEHGYAVDAIDISSVALDRARATAAERGLDVNWIEMDLEAGDVPGNHYDLIVIVRYTHPTLVADLIGQLADGGFLLCEEHLLTDRDVVGPTSPAFRTRPNELLGLSTGLRVIYYHEGLVEDPDGRTAALAQLVGCRGTAGF